MKNVYGKRILILIPHPDDEVVACAIAARRAQMEGAQLFSVYLTHGCLSRETMWPWDRKNFDQIIRRRRREGEAAAHFLSITPLNWAERAARHVWQQLPEIFEQVRRLLNPYNIDQLWLPAYEGGNPDHDATNALGQLLKNEISVLEFAEYNFKDGRANSHQFPYLNGQEIILHLTDEEQELKKRALKLYASEAMNLNYVKTEREAFRPLELYDYTQPPHPGALWYTRFQWVPFRHPRVDFTNPQDVSQAITSFLKDTNSSLRIVGK